MKEIDFQNVSRDLEAIEPRICEARSVAARHGLKLLSYLLAMVECEITDLIDKQLGFDTPPAAPE